MNIRHFGVAFTQAGTGSPFSQASLRSWQGGVSTRRADAVASGVPIIMGIAMGLGVGVEVGVFGFEV